jgi:hypothetical protein
MGLVGNDEPGGNDLGEALPLLRRDVCSPRSARGLVRVVRPFSGKVRFSHDSRRDNLSNDMALDTVRKISFKPTSRRSSHVQTGQDRLPRTGRGTVLRRASAQVTRLFGPDAALHAARLSGTRQSRIHVVRSS